MKISSNNRRQRSGAMGATSKAYLIGGGIGSMAVAAFMVRDGQVPAANIVIFEAGSLLGGSLDGAGDPAKGYSLRGGRMLTTDNYECMWDLYKTIPSLTDKTMSVFDENVDALPVVRLEAVEESG